MKNKKKLESIKLDTNVIIHEIDKYGEIEIEFEDFSYYLNLDKTFILIEFLRKQVENKL